MKIVNENKWNMKWNVNDNDNNIIWRNNVIWRK